MSAAGGDSALVSGVGSQAALEGGFWLTGGLRRGRRKAAGGYLADRLGVQPTALASLCLAALCFLGGSHPAAGLAALFCLT